MCHMSRVTSHMSLTPTATATDPPAANSLPMHSSLVCKDPKTKQSLKHSGNKQSSRSLQSNGKQGFKEGTNKQTDIATYRLNRPRGRFSKQRLTMHYGVCVLVSVEEVAEIGSATNEASPVQFTKLLFLVSIVILTVCQLLLVKRLTTTLPPENMNCPAYNIFTNPTLEKVSTVLLLLLLLLLLLCHAEGTPLDSEQWWTGELWSKTNLLKWQN